MQDQFDSAYRDYVFTCKRAIKVPRGKVVSGTRDHITGALGSEKENFDKRLHSTLMEIVSYLVSQ